MNILIDVGHPAHVHLFKNAAHQWENNGHRILFTIRNRSLIPELLKEYHFNYEIASKPRTGIIGQGYELIAHDLGVLKAAIKFKPDVMLGTSLSITHVSKILKAKSIVFSENDADYNPYFVYLAYPFADAIVVPDCLRDKKNQKYHTYKGYHELASLHPNQFTPDPSILEELGVKEGDKYFILRFVAFKAYHDVGQKGLSAEAQHRLIKLLSQYGKVFITNEGKLPDEYIPYQIPIPAHRIHHALYYATMVISDGTTMTTEAAILGTPSIRCNTYIGVFSIIEELEHKYGLSYGFLPSEEETMMVRIKSMLENPNLKKEWEQKRTKMLSDKVDVTAWIIDFIENIDQNI